MVEQRQDASIAERRSAEHRLNLVGDGSFTKCLLDLFRRHFLARQERFRDGVIDVGAGFDHLLPRALGVLEQGLRDGLAHRDLAVLAAEGHLLHRHQIGFRLSYETAELVQERPVVLG